MTFDEFQNMYTGFKIQDDGDCKNLTDKDIGDANAPNSWDWRDHNGVTPVKDQGGCGSCYAFSSIGHIESQYAIKHNKNISLSEQQIVDCDRVDSGCNGGFMSTVFESLIKMGGVESNADYPYIYNQSVCQFNKKKVIVKLKDCYSYALSSQEKVKQLLYKKGPLSIVICSDALVDYKKGIISDNFCTGILDHAVLLVGYGTENGTPYWIVKNSWGTDWGELGFFRMERGKGKKSCCMTRSDNHYTAAADIA